MRKSGHWRRWLAMLIILILIASGIVRIPRSLTVYANGTEPPAEDTSAGAVTGWAGDSSALNYEQLQSVSSVRRMTAGTLTSSSAEAGEQNESSDDPGTEQDAEEADQPGLEELNGSGLSGGEYDADPAVSESDADAEIHIEADDSEMAGSGSDEADPEEPTDAETDADEAGENAGTDEIDPDENRSLSEQLIDPQTMTLDVTGAGELMLLAAAASTSTMPDETYNFKKLVQAGYQMVVFGNATIRQHTMGGALIQGNLIAENGASAMADSEYVKAPSFVGGKISSSVGNFVFNGRSKQNPIQVLYVGSSNQVTNSGKTVNNLSGYSEYSGFNNGGTVEVNDSYVNWTKLLQTMTSLSGSLAAGSTQTYTNFGDEQLRSVTAGSNSTFSGMGTARVKLEITGSSSEYTVITIPDTGTVTVPKLQSYNGQTLSDGEQQYYENAPVIFNFPNASEVVVPEQQMSIIGHILAPNATVKMLERGNYNGMVVCKNLDTNAEGHLRVDYGEMPGPKGYTIYVNKIDQNGNGVSGAELVVRDTSWKPVKDLNGNSIGSFTSDGSPHALTNLAAGTYTLTETKAPDGYQASESITFQINETGTVSVNGQVQSEATVTMVDQRNYYAAVKKTDADGNPLAGAILEVRKVDTQEVVENFTTDGTDHGFQVDGNTQYVLHESEAPKGYQLAEDIYFYVASDGKVYRYDANGKNPAAVNDLVIVMQDEEAEPSPVEIEIGAEKLFKNGILNAGDFTFTLTGIGTDETTTEQVWHEGETTYIQHDAYDEYQYVGYGCGNYVYKDRDGWYYGWHYKKGYNQTQPGWGDYILVHHEAWTETITGDGYYETVYTTGKTLPPMPDGSSDGVITVTNGSGGTISFGKITYTTTGTWKYKIAEIANIYQGASDQSGKIIYDPSIYYAVVTVESCDGVLKATIRYEDENGNELCTANEHVNCDGQPILINEQKVEHFPQLRLHKVNGLDGDMTSDLYAQVRFTVKYTPEGGSQEAYPGTGANGQWQVDENGYIDFGKLQPGTYEITEAHAPEGYMQLTDPIIIVVAKDGSMTLQSGANNYVRLEEDNQELQTQKSIGGNGIVVETQCVDTGSSTLTTQCTDPRGTDLTVQCTDPTPDPDADFCQDMILVVRNYPYIEMPEAGSNSQLMCYTFGALITLAGIWMLLKNQKTPLKSVRIKTEHKTGGDTPA